MPESLTEKYPTQFNVKQVTKWLLGDELTLYFVTGVMNQIQAVNLKKFMPVCFECEIEKDRLVVTSLLTKQQLTNLCQVAEASSNKDRGQYYALYQAVAKACKEIA